jgi:hypothetical protein
MKRKLVKQKSARNDFSKIIDPDTSIQTMSKENNEKNFKNTLNNIIIDENDLNFNSMNINIENQSNFVTNDNDKSILQDTFFKKDAADNSQIINNEEDKTLLMNIGNCSYIPQNSQDRINNVDDKYSPFIDMNNQTENTTQTEKIKPISMFSISEKYLENVILK